MPKKTTSPRKPSSLEAAFSQLWSKTASSCPSIATLEAEVRVKPRRYKYDFLIPHTNVLIEINGGTYAKIRMGHSSGEGQHRDYEKARYAQMKGYLVFTYDSKQITPANLQELFTYVITRYPHLAN